MTAQFIPCISLRRAIRIYSNSECVVFSVFDQRDGSAETEVFRLELEINDADALACQFFNVTSAIRLKRAKREADEP